MFRDRKSVFDLSIYSPYISQQLKLRFAVHQQLRTRRKRAGLVHRSPGLKGE